MDGSFYTRSFLEIRLEQQPYGIPVEFVREITQVAEITPLPNSGAHVCGLMNLRGQVLPVVDLNVRLGHKKTVLTREAAVVVIDGIEGVVGVLVDGVARVINIIRDEIQPPPESLSLQNASLVTSIAKDGDRMVTLLDVLHCLETPEEFQEPQPIIGPDAVKLLG